MSKTAVTETKFQGAPAKLSGALPEIGSDLSGLTLTDQELNDFSLAKFAGQKVILNIFPSVDTEVCAASVRRFNQEAAQLDHTVVLCVSKDLPFAQGRFCGAEGIEQIQTVSAFRSQFGVETGLQLADSPLAGLLARCVLILDEQGKVIYRQLAPEITEEPDYQQALAQF